MLSALLLSLLSAAPDEFGPPLILEADALYLAHRLLKVEPRPAFEGDLAGSMWATTPAELDAQVCDVLFDDCSRHLDEFARKEALERHRPELEALRKQSSELKVVVLGGDACLGEYDFKKHSFPVKSFLLGLAGRREPASPSSSLPYGFSVVAKQVPQQLKVDEKVAAELVRESRCFDLRVEAVLPTKPIRWPATIRRVDPLTRIATIYPADPPEIPVDVKRIRLVSPQGATLVLF